VPLSIIRPGKIVCVGLNYEAELGVVVGTTASRSTASAL
jgi:hypothetical protein